MTPEEFHIYVKRLVKGYLPSSYRRAKVVIEDMEQPGSRPGKALKLMLDGGPVGSTVVLDPYISALQRGQAADSVVQDIAEACLPPKKPAQQAPRRRSRWRAQPLNPRNYLLIRPYLVTRLFDPQLHGELVNNRPWFKLGDWGMYLELALEDGSEIPVTYDLIRIWGITPQVVLRDAVAAQAAANPPWLSSYTGIEGTLGSNLLTATTPWQLSPSDLFVLSNSDRRYGASVVGWKDVLARTAGILGRSFALLPTSVHELMVVPDLDVFTHWDLESIIRDSRQGLSQAQEKDIFTDKIIWYDRGSHQLIGKHERREQEVGQLMHEPAAYTPGLRLSENKNAL